MRKPSIAIVSGTRPEIIKLAPVYHELAAQGWGEVRWIHLHSIALMSPDRRIAGHVATAEEVTERKAAEAKLEAAHQQLMTAALTSALLTSSETRR